MAVIIILGGSGFVGSRFCSYLGRMGVPHRSVGRQDVCLYDADELTREFARVRPDFVVNCAGFTGRPNVDACEECQTECLAANAVLPGIVDRACKTLGISWGHVSSGCIFTGNSPNGHGFTETDVPNFSFRQNNCSFYSGCKALGEETLSPFEDCYVWRLRIPFDHVDSSRNYISKLLRYDRLLEARNSLSHLDEFVAACWQCWEDSVPYGIYNLTNTGSVTTSEVVDLIKKYRLVNKSFDFFESEMEFMRVAARTPRSNCVLDNRKALRVGLQLSPVTEALERCLAEWRCARPGIAA